ncbi:MAG: GTPase Era [Deltaproteobacteria bacterium]|nr:GTPase Era [Deltaproteobacteria bacterium]
MDKNNFLSGFIAIVGPPNAGKSTLLNRLLGSKVAIVSPRPQTTRNRILGIYHGDGFQMAFIDTPGIHKTRTALHKSMVASAQEVFHEVDIVMVIIEMPRSNDPIILSILKDLKKSGKPSVLVINKIDAGRKRDLLPMIARFMDQHPFDAVIPLSALKNDGVDILVQELKKMLRPGPEFFPRDMHTDQSESFLISEIIREKIYFYTKSELPYSSAVSMDRIEDVPEKKLLSISARIHVESESQKAIIIGHKGKMIKTIGTAARKELEKMFKTRVYLELIARVEKNWSKDTKAMRRLGY